MAYKTFISYKYSEAKELRERILDALGADAKERLVNLLICQIEQRSILRKNLKI